MTRKTSQKVAILKQIALIPMIVVIGFLFSTRVIAQDNSKQPSTQNQPLFSNTDAPQSVINEYHALLSKYDITLKKAYESAIKNTPPFKNNAASNLNVKSADTAKKISKSDRTTMEQLYFKMSKQQQDNEFVQFRPIPEIKQKIIPTKEQFESWKNPKKYGIWFDRAKRQKNSVLNKYTNTDFYHYDLRILDESSAKIMKYQIEVGLLRKEEVDKYNAFIGSLQKSNPDDKYSMMFMIDTRKAKAKIDAENN